MGAVCRKERLRFLKPVVALMAVLGASVSVAAEPEAAPAPSVVAHYPLDGNLAEARGRARTGTAFGDIRFRPTGSGQAVRLDGSGAILIPSPGLGPLRSPFTLNLWVKVGDRGDPRGLLSIRGPEGSPLLTLFSDGHRLDLRMVNESVPLVSASVSGTLSHLETTAWNMISVVSAGRSLYLYINGSRVAETTGLHPVELPAGDLLLGTASLPVRDDGFVGLLDDFCLFDGALGDVELAGLLRAGRAERSSLASQVQLTPVVLRAGYTIDNVGSGVAADSITQMTFKPGDDDRLYAIKEYGDVVRYDYDRLTGNLANPLVLRSGLDQALGLGFHGDDLYVSMDKGAGDGRLTRLSDPDVNGVFQTRHDFVHSIPIGDHDVNQIQIVGNTLYVGIGAVGRKGDPAEENVYTMTLARIFDLTQVDFSGPIGPDFKGPINYLASETEWQNADGTDGQLRYYASGFRNPYGAAVDDDGDPWLSTNGNSDEGFKSPDYLYKKVPKRGQGKFPPPSFGFPPPLILGDPVEPLADLGQSPSPTGFDFVAGGSDIGMAVVAQFGASDQAQYPVGKDVIIVDPITGTFEILVDDLDGPTDVVRDPFGRLLISDYRDGSIWRLSPPLPGSGSVPDGASVPGSLLTLAKEPDGRITLTWGLSCVSGDTDYAVYEGTLGDFISHSPERCTTEGTTSATLDSAGGSTYYLVVPNNGFNEGSYGRRSDLSERPQQLSGCLPQNLTACD